MNKFLLAISFGLIAFVLLAIPTAATACAQTPVAGCAARDDLSNFPTVAREEIIARAKSWLGSSLRYNQRGWKLIDSETDIGYRQDCSGYVSLALRGSNCWTTVQIHSIATIPISKDELRPGDLINNKSPGNSGHVIIFDRWADANREQYWGYDFSGLGIQYRQVSYPFRGRSGYEPRRYKNVCVEGSRYVAQSDSPTVAPGERFQIWFELENNGTCTWQESYNYGLVNANGTNLGAGNAAVAGPVASGERQRWTLDMIAPDTPGEYVTEWRMNHDGYLFGDAPWIRVIVAAPAPVSDGDNEAADANWLAMGESQVHDIVPADDQDWFAFDLDNAAAVLVQTAGEAGDTTLTLFDSSLSTLVYNDDEGGGSYFSRLETQCLPAGRYYARVEELDNDSTIDDYTIYYWNLGQCDSGGAADDSGTVEEEHQPAPLPAAETRYRVDPGNFVCGDIIGLEFIPRHDEQRIDFNVAKCDFTPIRVSGRLFLVADNGDQIGPIHYSAGAVIISGSFDPINDLGLAGWHQWEAHVYPDGQDYPIESPLQAAWEVVE